MKKKILISITIVILMFEIVIPLQVFATPVETADTMAGVLLEPTVKFFTFLIDSVMSAFSAFMNQEDFKFIMVDDIDEIQDYGEVPSTPYTILDVDSYRNIWGQVNVKYPNFTYTPEQIFSGEIALLDINFLDTSNTDSSWGKIQSVISTWYKILRGIAIIGLLSILIYIGIKIIITSNAKDKSKYKTFIINWFMAVVLLFSMHYIMAFILNIIEQVMELLQGIAGVIEVSIDGRTFKTNLMGLARFQIQNHNMSVELGYLIIYAALVAFTVKFTIIYFKRVLNMAFFTLIAPIVALTYPIDKMEGKAKGFEMWLKDFLYNALLQPMHYILYYILITTSLSLAANNLLYAITAIMFVSEAEKLLKKIFGFGKANGGTVNGLAGALATGAAVTMFKKWVKDPLHPDKALGISFSEGSSSSNNTNSGNLIDDEPNDIIEDTNFDAILKNGFGISSGNVSLQENNNSGDGNLQIPGVNNSINEYRKKLSDSSIDELGGISFNDNDSRSNEELIKILARRKEKGNTSNSDQLDSIKALLQNRIENNESNFSKKGIPLQYSDGDARSTSELMEEAIRYKNLANNRDLNENKRRKHERTYQELINKINRRMAENQYINLHGGPESILKKEEGESERKTPRILKGTAHVAKTLVKPVWDVEKSGKENTKKLVGKVLKGVAGAGAGITAAAVQAGISLTDGKYNALEGVATATAGFVGVTQLGKGADGIGKTYKDGANAGEESTQTIKEYGERWFNRDDVIAEFNREFAGQGKNMRRRAVENYVSRGITDAKEQIKAIKYAEMLRKERGMNENDADKVAAATLQYRQGLNSHGNYSILYDSEKREAYLKAQANAYTGSASKDSVTRLHNEFIQNVRDFDRANN